jgi:hypothetical protein
MPFVEVRELDVKLVRDIALRNVFEYCMMGRRRNHLCNMSDRTNVKDSNKVIDLRNPLAYILVG